MGAPAGWLVLLLLELAFFLLFILYYPVFFVSDDTYQLLIQCGQSWTFLRPGMPYV